MKEKDRIKYDHNHIDIVAKCVVGYKPHNIQRYSDEVN